MVNSQLLRLAPCLPSHSTLCIPLGVTSKPGLRLMNALPALRGSGRLRSCVREAVAQSGQRQIGQAAWQQKNASKHLEAPVRLFGTLDTGVLMMLAHSAQEVGLPRMTSTEVLFESVCHFISCSSTLPWLGCRDSWPSWPWQLQVRMKTPHSVRRSRTLRMPPAATTSGRKHHLRSMWLDPIRRNWRPYTYTVLRQDCSFRPGN